LTYHRLPKKLSRSSTIVLYESEQEVVLCNLLHPSEPLIAENSILLDKNFIGVWYCPYKNWHDIAAIYDTQKNFKGYYCDICSPVKKITDGYEITDFFLDLWIFPNGKYIILDQDEFNNAILQRWMNKNQIIKARSELHNLKKKVKTKKYPSSKIKKLIQLPRNINEIINLLTS
jgi:predicted RNA-binding protein associated with RNAse of E/G family